MKTITVEPLSDADEQNKSICRQLSEEGVIIRRDSSLLPWLIAGGLAVLLILK